MRRKLFLENNIFLDKQKITGNLNHWLTPVLGLPLFVYTHYYIYRK